MSTVYAYIYTYIHIYIHIHTYIYTYTHIYTHTYIYIHIHTCAARTPMKDDACEIPLFFIVFDLLVFLVLRVQGWGGGGGGRDIHAYNCLYACEIPL